MTAGAGPAPIVDPTTARKDTLVEALARAVGVPPPPMSAGSTEPRSILADAASWLGLPTTGRKPDLAKAIVESADMTWRPDFASSGDTVTRSGLAAVYVAVLRHAEAKTTAKIGRKDGAQVQDPDVAFHDEGDERSLLEEAIRAAFDALAAAPSAPLGEVTPAAQVDLSNSAFSDGSWLRATVALQDWLRLPEPLEDSAPPEAVADLLFRSLGEQDPSQAHAKVDGVVRLLPRGLELLQSRAERAVSLMERFLEELETLSSATAATSNWVTAWEELDDQVEHSASIQASAKVWSINEFSSRADSGRLDLSPSFQRGDVWATKDAQQLIESILRGIPLPSVILMEPDSYDLPYEVVDGKQRLTSILRFIGKHPDAVRRVREQDERTPGHNLLSLFENSYPRFRQKWSEVTHQTLTTSLEREYYFPFKLATSTNSLQGDLAPLRGKYYTSIRTQRIRVSGEHLEVRQLFENTCEYKIPLIQYTKATRQQIHEVFSLYNKQGKHLNAEEIRNAVYHDVRLMRVLAVAAGDDPGIDSVLEFLGETAQRPLEHIAEMLQAYNFGDARFRRTKVLCWLYAMVFVDPVVNGAVAKLSTAQHINGMLERIKKPDADPLQRPDVLLRSLHLVERAMEAHSSLDAEWAAGFKDSKNNQRWEELQLIATLVGFTLAAVVLEEDTYDEVQHHASSFEGRSRQWARPTKTQTAEQWRYISRVAVGVLEELGVDPASAEQALGVLAGPNSVAALVALAAR